jgi:catechol 2,3-dioxygenase-like lactoylglutathione lyase family enzyme
VPQFAVTDLVRTTAYYRDVLGFRIEGYWDGEQVTTDPSAESVFAIVSRDDVQFFFNRSPGAPVRTGRADGTNDVYLRTTGVDALAGELRTRGARLRGEPETQVYGQRELVVEDCNGLVLTFGEEVPRTGA